MSQTEKMLKRKAMIKNLYLVSLGAFALGLILTIIGVAASVAGLIVVGVLLCIAGVVGVFVLFYYTHDYNWLYQVHQAITKDKLYDFEDISKKTRRSTHEVRTAVADLIRRQWLVGYVRRGEKVLPRSELVKEASETKISERAVKCSTCGASFTTDSTLCICPYCGNTSNLEN